ncbi:HsdS-like protein of Type I restriction-modification system [Bifidobacterium callitrichos DSM 23973]|uniref:HsdS-like protein of Type I restriction-modification system n=2 Tax=Bifidobacterium callitrichos TaxID=762209 RepID=A0A086ZXR3_9BIFI|nr:HsdS-like protein of Type I restriction-modification system [Bifidobacterium callitrichos DSM 23973]
MTENSNIPSIRFAGFTDSWEQRKLGEIASFTKGNGYSKADIRESGVPLFLYGRMYTQYEAKVEFVNTYAEPKQGTLYSKGAEVVVPASGESAEDIARASAITKAGIALGGDLNVIYPHPVAVPLFLAYGLSHGSSQQLLAQRAQGKTVVHIHASDLEGLNISLPSTVEQQAIGRFFSRLDDLITLHQRKHDKLVVFKKAMLEQMFPQEGETVPKVRFAGFTDPWEQRKLGELVQRITRKNSDNESDLPLTISAQYGLIDQRLFFNSQVASKDMSGYYLLRKGEFAYNKSTSVDSPWGAIKRLTQYEKGCVSTLYICFELLGADPDYLVTYYETNRWYKAVQMIAAEGARNHGLLNIAPDDFFETTLSVPPSAAEQQKVGNFFSRLDDLITLHQRKHRCLMWVI